MRLILLFFVCSLLVLVACKEAGNTVLISENERTNVLLIVIDDLGFTDLGCYGSEIKTPNIDALASNGIRNTSFYTAPTCSPTRAMLLTGTTTHKSGFGTMAGDWADNQLGKPGYEGFLNFNVVTFPKLLQEEGYHTSIAGKWHLAFPPKTKEQWPINRGFDRSFCLMQGGGGHFADKQPLLKFMNEALYVEDTVLVNDLPKAFYSSINYTDKAVSYIKESKVLNKPFFHFLSFTAPHWPLQVPDEYINLYKGKYDEGYEALAKSRFEKAKALGVIPKNTKFPELSPNVKPWDELSLSEQQLAIKNMEIYAAMIEVVDMQIGRVLNFLKEEGLHENTAIILMSDNGAEGNSIMTYEGTGEWVSATFDNSLENIGRINSYTQLDAAWAQVASLPFKWYKAFAYEGGIRVPAIFSYPKWNKEKNIINTDFLSAMDIAPTVLELANVSHPDSIYQERKIYPMDGKSMLAWLNNETENVHQKNEPHVWELFGRIGVRSGDWKAEKVEPPYGNGNWELYNLKEDLIESTDISEENPEKLKELIMHWKEYEVKNHVIYPDKPTAYSKEIYWRENK